jgi:hypothetical protein
MVARDPIPWRALLSPKRYSFLLMALSHPGRFEPLEVFWIYLFLSFANIFLLVCMH